jgi:hypothetical protein
LFLEERKKKEGQHRTSGEPARVLIGFEKRRRQEQSCTGTDGVLVTPWHLFLVILEKRVQGVV